MNWKVTVLGIVLFLVFWAFQAGYANSLGTSAWFLGVIIFTVLLWAIGKALMPKGSAESKELWMFATAFVVISTLVISYLGPAFGAVFPAGFTASQLTPLVLSFWLMVYGGAMFVGGWQGKKGVMTLIGVIWLVSAMHFVTALSTGPNSYLHFALVTGLPFILWGIMAKK